MTDAELRQELEALLSEELGIYSIGTPPNPVSYTPAIVALDEGESLPSDWKVEGLEVVMLRTPISHRFAGIHGGTNPQKTWQVFLTQYQGERTIDAALIKVGLRFPGTQANPTQINKQKNMLSQQSVRIPDFVEFFEDELIA